MFCGDMYPAGIVDFGRSADQEGYVYDYVQLPADLGGHDGFVFDILSDVQQASGVEKQSRGTIEFGEGRISGHY